MSRFVRVWFGRLVSMVGSGLTAFALGIWVYRKTGSVTHFALSAFFTTLPGLLLSPLAGALVDRWPRRRVLVSADVAAAGAVLAAGTLVFSGRLEVWHVYALNAILAACVAFQWPAFSASIPLLVPKESLGRANAMAQLAETSGQTLSPLLAGVLLGAFSLGGVLLVDVVSYFASIAMLLATPFGDARRTPFAGPRASLTADVGYGWRYLLERPGLLALLGLFAANNFLVGLVVVLTTPLILSVSTPAVLGRVLSLAAAGAVAGGLALTVWRGPKRRIRLILALELVGGLCILMAGLRPSPAFVAAAAFVLLFCLTAINVSSQTVWQSKVRPDVQGRVFATRRMIAWSCLPLAHLVSGPLVDRLFRPLMNAGGPTAEAFAAVVGSGPDSSVALVFVLAGLLSAVSVAAAYSYRPLRCLEDELPDAIDARPAMNAPAVAASTP